MKVQVRVLSAALVLALLTSCSVGDVRRTGGQQPTTLATTTASPAAMPSGLPTTPPVRAECALEAQPRRLLATDDVWPLADLDGISQVAYQLYDSCDSGPSWPQDCAPFFGRVLHDGWPNYRPEGAIYIAAISLLNTSGQTTEEHVLLFRTPSSNGLKLLADHARTCNAESAKHTSGAVLYRFPRQGSAQRFLVVDQSVAILLSTPSSLDPNPLISTAVRRARGSK